MKLKDAMHKEYRINETQPIYDPEKFEQFCKEAGCQSLFTTLMEAQSASRQSPERLALNKVRTVAILYRLAFGLSQWCNVFQRDFGTLIKQSGTSQSAIETTRIIGDSVSSQLLGKNDAQVCENHQRLLKEFIDDVMKKQCLLVAAIDDYHTCFSRRRPTDEQTSVNHPMCTIVIKKFPSIQAIPVRADANNPSGINPEKVANFITGFENIKMITKKTCASAMPSWIRERFFQPEMERNRLSAHEYSQSTDAQLLRQMNDLQLVDFLELPLKTQANYKEAIKLLTNSAAKEYIEKYHLILLGDHPTQFYSRKVVYEAIQGHNSWQTTTSSSNVSETSNSSSDSSLNSSSNSSSSDSSSTTSATSDCSSTSVTSNHSSASATSHSSSTSTSSHTSSSCTSSMSNSNSSNNSSTSASSELSSLIKSILVFIGALHVQLSAREEVVLMFWEFFNWLYEDVFSKKNFPQKPLPWRISMVLEVAYGGWTLIRESVKSKFNKCKNIEYQVLINLLDNYIPSVLSIYSVVFKLNDFNNYVKSFIRAWVMFVCFQRRHYNKSPLVWFGTYLYWKENHPHLASLMEEFITVFDEYMVENTHSIIRRSTNLLDPVPVLIKKVKDVFANREAQANFRETFGHTKNHTFSKNQMRYLKLKAASSILKVIHCISSQQSPLQFKIVDNQKLWKLPSIFGEKFVDVRTLPLGFHTKYEPSPKSACDDPDCSCASDTSSNWYINEGCGHSFHSNCVQSSLPCPLCKEFLFNKAKELGQTAKDAIFAEPTSPGDSTDDNEEDTLPTTGSIDSDEQYEQAISQLNETICELNPPSLTPEPINVTTYADSVKKGPHCTTCKHTVKGHRKVNGRKLCEGCPGSSECSASGRQIECKCEWHSVNRATSQPNNHPPNPTESRAASASVTSAFTLSNNATNTTATTATTVTQGNMTTATATSTNIAPSASVIVNQPTGATQLSISGYDDVVGIRELYLCSTLSQGALPGRNGSSACTTIALLLCRLLLEGVLPRIIVNGQLNQSLVTVFKQAMESGNQMHDGMMIRYHQDTFTVDFVTRNTPSVRLKIKEEHNQIDSVTALSAIISAIPQTNARNYAFVIVLPPGNSVAFFVYSNGTAAIMDSHGHNPYGALVTLIGKTTWKPSLANYLNSMCRRFWGSDLSQQADFIEVELA